MRLKNNNSALRPESSDSVSRNLKITSMVAGLALSASACAIDNEAFANALPMDFPCQGKVVETVELGNTDAQLKLVKTAIGDVCVVLKTDNDFYYNDSSVNKPRLMSIEATFDDGETQLVQEEVNRYTSPINVEPNECVNIRAVAEPIDPATNGTSPSEVTLGFCNVESSDGEDALKNYQVSKL